MLRSVVIVALMTSLWACSPKKKANSKRQTGSRIAAVTSAKTTGAVNDKSGFCEKTYPSTGEDSRVFAWPKLRPLPGETKIRTIQAKARWTWVNLWATWCEPCMDEMALLGRWTRSLASEGQGISLELLTIDAVKDEAKLAQQIKKGLPGPVLWLNDPEKFGTFLDHLGVDRGAAIPIHALVDPKGQLRCVRVGAIHALDFAAVKGILQGG